MKNWNILFLVLFLFTSMPHSFGQSVSIDNISNNGFSGLKSIDNKMYYLLAAIDGSFDDRELILISPELELLERHRMALGRLVKIRAIASNDNSVLVYISADKVGHLYLFDLAGKQLQHREVEAPSEWFNTAELFSAGDKGYYLVRQIKPKKVGFSVELLSPTLETTWRKDYVPEKQKYLPVVSAGDQNQVAVIYTHQKLTKVVCIGADGQEKYQKELAHSNEDMMLKSSHAAFNATGDLVVFGNFEEKSMVKYTGQRYRYFFTGLDQTGNSKFFQAEPWNDKQIEQIVNKSVFSIYSEGKTPDFFIHEFNTTDNGYEIVGETYRFVVASHKDYPAVGGGKRVEDSNPANIYSKPGFFYAMDLIIVNYDKDGKLIGFDRTSRPVKRTTSLGSINGRNPENVANSFVDFGLFNYRYTTKASDGKQIRISLSQHFNNIYTSFIRSEDQFDNIFTRDYLEIPLKVSQKKGELSNAKFKEEDLSYKTLGTNNWMVQTNILPTNKVGKYLLVQFGSGKLTLTLRDFEPETKADFIKGIQTHKISYTPAFDNKLVVMYYSESGDEGEHWVYYLINQEMQIENKQVIIIPKGANGMRAIPNGDAVLFTWSIGKGKDYILLMDKDSQIIKQKSLDHLSKSYPNVLAAGVYHATETGYYSLNKINEAGQNHYIVSAYNDQFEDNWRKNYGDIGAKNASFDIVSANNTGILIKTRRAWKERKSTQNFSFNSDQLIEISKEGVKTEKNALLSENEWRQALVYTSDSENTFYAAGVNFIATTTATGETEKNSDGLWLQPLNQNTNLEVLSWTKIAEEFGAPSLSEKLKQGELRFRLMKLTETDGTIMLLTELVFYENAATNPLKYTRGSGILTDFVVFNFNKLGKYQGYHFIEKNVLNIASINNAMNSFSFQYLTNDGNNIVYTDLGNDMEPYAVSTPISNVVPRKLAVAHGRLNDAAKPTEIDVQDHKTEFEKRLDTLSQKVDRIDQKISNFSIWGNKTADKRPMAPRFKYKSYTGYINGGLEHIYLYHYNKSKGQLRLDNQKMQ